MKSSRNLKIGVILLVIALAVGVFALVVWADGNGTYGMRGGSSGNIVTPRYGMQNKGNSNQEQNQNCEDCTGSPNNGMGNKEDAPDKDGDGIPNGQDEDYAPICDGECEGTCDGIPQGNGWGRNSLENREIAGNSINISGREMKTLTIAKIANLWGVDANQLLEGIKNEFKLTQPYTLTNTIDDLRGEYRFSPYQIMEIAERIKTASVE